MKKYDKMISYIDNSRLYHYYNERIINCALSQFVWTGKIFEGKDRTGDRLYFERKLLGLGKATICRVKDSDIWLTCGYVNKGTLNFYGYPTEISAIGFNKSYVEVDEFEIIYDNQTMQPLLPKIDLYARLLAEAHATFRANLRQQNTPYICVANQFNKDGMSNLFDDVFTHEPVIYVKKKEDVADSVNVFKFDTPYIGTTILADMRSLWNEALSMLGITPAGIDKNERMTTSEVGFAEEEYIVTKNSRYENRKELCERMKDHGVDIDVHMVQPSDVDLAMPTELVRKDVTMTHYDDNEKEDEDNG